MGTVGRSASHELVRETRRTVRDVRVFGSVLSFGLGVGEWRGVECVGRCRSRRDGREEFSCNFLFGLPACLFLL